MKFEVDNTTKQLVEELQGSIRTTILSVQEGQEDIKSIIEEMKQAVYAVPSMKQLNDLKDDFLKDNKKTTTQLTESLSELKGLVENNLKIKRFMMSLNDWNKRKEHI